MDPQLPGDWGGHGCHSSLGLPGEDDLEALKAKNIKQTELVADLREAILRVARHFQCTDPKNCSVVSCGLNLGALAPQPPCEAPKPWRGGTSPLEQAFLPVGQELSPDYSMESHQRDHENYVACSRSHRRRAKALLDFERHDDDELGFRKNDIITVRGAQGAGTPGLSQPVPVLVPPARPRAQPHGCRRRAWATKALLPLLRRPTVQIISQKDEHCWVGELNGLRGEASARTRGGLGRGPGSPGCPPRALWPQRELGFLSQRACPHTALTPFPGGGCADAGRPLLTGPRFSHRLVSSQVCGSPG